MTDCRCRGRASSSTPRCSLNLLTALVWRSLEGRSSSRSRAASAWTWAVVAAQAASGYAIGALLKYVDAIGQVAGVIAMLVTLFSEGDFGICLTC